MRALLICDTVAFAQTVARSLSTSGFVVEHVLDVQLADTALRAGPFELVIVRFTQPEGVWSRDVCNLRWQMRGLARMLGTVHTGAEGAVERLLDAGVDDVLTEPIADRELRARALALVRRMGGTQTSVLKVGGLLIDLERGRVTHRGVPIVLGKRAWALLAHLAIFRGIVVHRSHLLECLCASEGHLTANSLEAAVHRLRVILEPYGARIRTVRGVGYVLSDLAPRPLPASASIEREARP